MLCSLLFVNEVVKRDEKKLYYLLGDGGEGSLEAFGGLTAGKRVMMKLALPGTFVFLPLGLMMNLKTYF